MPIDLINKKMDAIKMLNLEVNRQELFLKVVTFNKDIGDVSKWRL